MRPLPMIRKLLALQMLVLVVCLLRGGNLVAVDVTTPVDVPDEIGLGERLALIAWLKEHGVAVKDPDDLPALRLAYLTRTRPEIVAAAKTRSDADTQRADLAAELYRKHRINPPADADAAAIKALIARLDGESDATLARDQAKAAADSRLPDRPQPTPAPAAPTARTPATPPVLPGRTATAEDPAQMAAGIVVGQPFPEFAGRTLDGAAFSLKDYRGKVVLIDFWATWCGPCMREMPNVKAVYEAQHAKGFEVVGVSLDEDKEVLKQGLATLGIPWLQLFEGAAWDSVLVRRCAVRGIPATFLIGKDGILLASNLRGQALAAAVEQALGR
jgi:thiol-disulfide isomerase/thioredoxin